MKYASIIMTHYSLADDYGEKRLGIKISHPRKKMLEDLGFNLSNYTRSNLLREHMDSLTKNTKYPHELIVVDNGGSPDDSDYLMGFVRKGLINTYIRNKDNMCFGYARNQALEMASGDYIVITDNDLHFKEGWLTECIGLLEKYPDKKFIATPYITPDKDKEKYRRGDIDGNRLNSSAGSNCLVMTRKIMNEIGKFSYGSTSGSVWQRQMGKNGYMIIMPPKDMAEHLGALGGMTIKRKIDVYKTLSDGTKITLF